MSEKKVRCNILVCGIVSSGSSALHNLLKEYDNIGYFSNEFDNFRAPGLIADQLSETSSLNHRNKIDELTKFSTLAKKWIYKSLIWKFIFNCIPKKYLESDCNIKIFDKIRLKLIALYNLYLLNQLNKSLKSDISFDEKTQITSKWIQDIGSIFSTVKDCVMYDQPILTATDIGTWTTVFNSYKLIIVYRDPRDQIAEIIKRGNLFAAYKKPYMTLVVDNLEAIYGKDKMGLTRFHIDAIKNRLKWIDYLERKLTKDRLLLIDFEGLVNNYDDYKSKVEDFIGVTKANHKFKNKFFNPIKSKENIGIYNKYLSKG